MEASSRAACNWSVFSCSSRRAPLTSRKIRTQPDTCPVSSRMGAALSSIGALAPVLADEQRVVREADDDPFPDRSCGGAFHRLAGLLVDDAEHLLQGPADGLRLAPPGQRLRDGVEVVTRPPVSVVMTASPMLWSVTRRTSRRWLARAWARRIAPPKPMIREQVKR